MRITLDFNVLLNLRDSTGQYVAAREILKLHDSGQLTICIPAMAASEYGPDQLSLRDFGDFEAFVQSVGIRGYEEIHPLCCIGVSFIGHCVPADDATIQQDREIHQLLFPEIPFDYAEYCGANGIDEDDPMDRRWLNARCDVQALWPHIHCGCDVFVTEDRNFHKLTKKTRLEKLGAKRIARPEEIV